jgi:hypothetical protein
MIPKGCGAPFCAPSVNPPNHIAAPTDAEKMRQMRSTRRSKLLSRMTELIGPGERDRRDFLEASGKTCRGYSPVICDG